MPVTRVSKIFLLAALALNFSIVATNNILDYDSNYQFVKHVLLMDTTFPGNNLMWRSISSPAVYTIFYISIIVWELSIAVILWLGAYRLLKMIKRGANAFNPVKETAVIGLTLSLLLWFTAFITVGGEWFLMWQSTEWNGESAALQYFIVSGIVLIYLKMKDE